MSHKVIHFIVDTQLPPSLSVFFKRKNIDSTHVTDYPSGVLMQDDEIRTIAVSENRIIVSKDIDFFDYFLLKGYPPAVLLLQLGNIKNRDLFTYLNSHINTLRNLFIEDNKRLIVLNRHKIIIY